jgi:hypothetical protein
MMLSQGPDVGGSTSTGGWGKLGLSLDQTDLPQGLINPFPASLFLGSLHGIGRWSKRASTWQHGWFGLSLGARFSIGSSPFARLSCVHARTDRSGGRVYLWRGMCSIGLPPFRLKPPS